MSTGSDTGRRSRSRLCPNSRLHRSNRHPMTFHPGYAATRISSNLNGSTKQFGWLQAIATKYSLVFNNFHTPCSHPNLHVAGTAICYTLYSFLVVNRGVSEFSRRKLRISSRSGRLFGVHSWCTLACKWDDSVQLTACQVIQNK